MEYAYILLFTAIVIGIIWTSIVCMNRHIDKVVKNRMKTDRELEVELEVIKRTRYYHVLNLYLLGIIRDIFRDFPIARNYIFLEKSSADLKKMGLSNDDDPAFFRESVKTFIEDLKQNARKSDYENHSR
jgi:hypothetical protein